MQLRTPFHFGVTDRTALAPPIVPAGPAFCEPGLQVRPLHPVEMPHALQLQGFVTAGEAACSSPNPTPERRG